MKNLLTRLVREEKGQDVVEYGLITAAISIAAIPFVPSIGTVVGGWWSAASASITAGAVAS